MSLINLLIIFNVIGEGSAKFFYITGINPFRRIDSLQNLDFARFELDSRRF
jgi:hypothetical protein